jgi:hypothetical protein
MALHPIFNDIDHGELEEVQRRVRMDPAVLEERWWSFMGMTSLIYAIFKRQPAIALWLIHHRGQHDLDTTDYSGWTALHWACWYGPLSVVQALVGAGANAAALDNDRSTLLMKAALNNHSDIVAFLLQQPAVKAAINHIDQHHNTALSLASHYGHQPIVQLLLDTGGANPTIPDGNKSPLSRAISRGHTETAALLRCSLAASHAARSLLKARSLLDAAHAIPKARKDAADKGEPLAVQQKKALAVAPAYLKGRVAEGRVLPTVAIVVVEEEDEELVACLKYALGLEGGGGWHEGEGPAPQEGMLGEMFVELCELLVPTWDRANV